MSILVNNKTKLVVQGITGKEGSFHTKQMISYGTQVVAGVTPGKGGSRDDNGIPIFNTLQEAIQETKSELQLWLTLHRSLSIVGYAAFTLAFVAGVMYLIQENQLKTKTK